MEPGQESGHQREGEKARVDRELIELLNELRVILPGVQVLFAFLLTVPFSNGFSRMTHLQRDVYFVAFACAALATIMLITPSTYHRLLFRRRHKERLIYTANRLIVVGTAFLAASMTSAVFVITDVLYKVPAASASAAAAALFAFGFWYAFPLYRRRTSPRE